MCRGMNFNLEPQASDSHAKGTPVPRSSLPRLALGAGQPQAACQPVSASSLMHPRVEGSETVTGVPHPLGLDLKAGFCAERLC